jgi:lipoprotein-anchoring transpeptidase ErfK/SrfK
MNTLPRQRPRTFCPTGFSFALTAAAAVALGAESAAAQTTRDCFLIFCRDQPAYGPYDGRPPPYGQPGYDRPGRYEPPAYERPAPYAPQDPYAQPGPYAQPSPYAQPGPYARPEGPPAPPWQREPGWHAQPGWQEEPAPESYRPGVPAWQSGRQDYRQDYRQSYRQDDQGYGIPDDGRSDWRPDYGAYAGVYARIYAESGNEKFPVPALPLSYVDPAFLRRSVAYDTSEAPGTIVIDPRHHFLYFVEGGGRAVRYGVGVGRTGFGWSGVATVHHKHAWPDWYPPREMIERQPEIKAKMMELEGGLGMHGGLGNPLGARALYLFQGGRDTLYRIHGTMEPWTIGHNVSSGCIRMINQDVIDLYERAPVGAKVVVLSSRESAAWQQ